MCEAVRLGGRHLPHQLHLYALLQPREMLRRLLRCTPAKQKTFAAQQTATHALTESCAPYNPLKVWRMSIILRHYLS
jgi:hypothetical protein